MYVPGVGRVVPQEVYQAPLPYHEVSGRQFRGGPDPEVVLELLYGVLGDGLSRQVPDEQLGLVPGQRGGVLEIELLLLHNAVRLLLEELRVEARQQQEGQEEYGQLLHRLSSL